VELSGVGGHVVDRCGGWACCKKVPQSSISAYDGPSCLKGGARSWQHNSGTPSSPAGVGVADLIIAKCNNACWHEWHLDLGHMFIHFRAYVLSTTFLLQSN